MFKVTTAFLLVVMAMLDTFFAYAFPVDFTFQSFSFISHLCVMGLLIWTLEMEWLNRLLLGALCGILFDFFFTSNFPLSFILFPILTVSTGALYQQFQEDIRIRYGLVLIGVVLVDWIPFIGFKLLRSIQVSFGTWLIHVGFFTILYHIVLLVGYHYLSDYMFNHTPQE